MAMEVIYMVMGKKRLAGFALVLSIVLLAGCSAFGDRADHTSNFIISFSEDTNIHSVAIEVGDVETSVGQNADNSTFQAGDFLGFDMPEIDNFTFALRMIHKNGKTVLYKEEMTESFSEGRTVKMTLSIDANGKYVLTQ